MACAYPDDNPDSPYTDEVENSIRLSALLINEGTKALRSKFLDKVNQKKFGSLIQLLNNQNVKPILDSYYKATKGKPKLLNEAQYKILYPVKGVPDIHLFDLTLLTFLFRNVFNEKPPPTTRNWRDEPASHDHSLSADLVRLRLMRNNLYGHITHTSLSHSEYQKHLSKLEAILLRMNCKQDDLELWKTKPLSATDEQRYINKMTQLMENDLADMHVLLKEVNKLPPKIKCILEEHSSNIEDMLNELSCNTSTSFMDMEFMIANLLEALAQVPYNVASCIINTIQSNNKEIASALNDIKEEEKRTQDISKEQHQQQKEQLELLSKSQRVTHEKVSKVARTVSYDSKAIKDLKDHTIKVAETISSESKDIKDIREQTKDIQKNVKELCEDLEQSKDLECTSVTEISRILHEHKEAFKVLLYNKPTVLHGDNMHIKNAFCFALGSVPWDIIIDLDHDSRMECGMFDKIALFLAKHRDFKVVTYSEIAKFNDDDKDIVAKGMKTMWLLANGCSQIGCNPSEKQFGMVITEMYPFLKSTVNRLQSVRPLIFINLVMGNTTKKPIARLVQSFTDICESTQERIDFEHSLIVSLYFDKSHMSVVPKTDDDISHITNCLSPAQLVYILKQCYPTQDLEKQYSYPGDKSQCFMSADDMAKLQPYAELYHNTIGQIDVDGKCDAEVETMVEEIKHNFLKGNPLSPEAMYVNESCYQILVARSEMREILDITGKILEESENWQKNKTYHGQLQITHDASGSGTTTAIYLLYNLRKRYPSLLIKLIDEKTISLLKNISRDSRKPLLLVVDSSEYRESDIESLQYRLQNEAIKCVIVHVRRFVIHNSLNIRESRHKKSSLSETHCYLSSTLQNEQDKVAFRKLYDSVRSHIRADRVYLFGLIAFCEDYKRLNHHINVCFENMTICQRNALSLVFFVWKFCHSCVSISLLRHLSESEKKTTDLENLLGYGVDLVLNDKLKSSVRPAHQCLLEPFQEKLTKEHCSAKAIMTTFMDNLYNMFSANNASIEDSSKVCYELFLQREKSLVEFFSPLISALSSTCGKEYVVEQILRFMKLYQGVASLQLKGEHLRGLYARYLMYRMNKPEEAIEQIVIAVGLQTSQSIISSDNSKASASLLSIYAGLFRQYGIQIFQKFKDNSPILALNESLGYFSESVRAHQRAQTVATTYSVTGHNRIYRFTASVPFIGEAKARHTVLDLCFVHICKGNHETFSKFIQKSENSFLKECENEAVSALEKLEMFIVMNRITDDEPGTTRNLITEFKYKLLLLRYDKNTTVTKMLKTLPDHVPCDIGMIVRHENPTLKYKSGTKQDWTNLTCEQLQLIVDTILKRARVTSSAMLYSNYSDCLIAMIRLRHIKGGGNFRKYNVDLALQLAKEWNKSSSNDISAIYIYGCILLAKGLDEKNIEVIKEAVQSFERCHTLCKNNLTARSVRTLKYAICNGTGLEKLLPIDQSRGKGNLQLFYGRMSDKNHVTVLPFRGVLKAKVPNGHRFTADEQKPLLKFNISLRKIDPIHASDIERVPNEEVVKEA